MIFWPPTQERAAEEHYSGDDWIPSDLFRITHVLHFPEGLRDGYVALSIERFEENENPTQ